MEGLDHDLDREESRCDAGEGRGDRDGLAWGRGGWVRRGAEVRKEGS